jgi:hypothetical protein
VEFRAVLEAVTDYYERRMVEFEARLKKTWRIRHSRPPRSFRNAPPDSPDRVTFLIDKEPVFPTFDC